MHERVAFRVADSSRRPTRPVANAIVTRTAEIAAIERFVDGIDNGAGLPPATERGRAGTSLEARFRSSHPT